MKTNAARLLDQKKVEYRLVEYEVDPEDLSAGTVAAKIGVPLERVFKTLVVRGDRHGICFAVVAGGDELDQKALARVTGDRSITPVPLREVQPLTGYVRGGVTVLGAKKAFPVWVDESILNYGEVSVSAGIRGTQILLSPGDYIRVTGARVAQIAAPRA